MKRVFRFGDFTLEGDEHRLARGNQEIYLQPKTFETLLYLVNRHGHLVKKSELLDALWAGTFVTENALTRCIKEAREALHDDAHESRYIKTIPRVGYKFIAAVEEIEETAGLEEAPQPKSGDRTSLRHVIKVSVLALSLVLVGAFIYYYIRHKETSAPKVKAIAVLPFKPLAGATRDESLELGMADTLITRLGNITEIKVRPISAVRRYTSLEQDPIVAGREQQVDAVLDGSIQKSSDQIRVTVRLLRVVDGAQLWTAKFDQKAGDIFAIQDSISEQIAATLAVGVSGQERELLSRHSTSDPEAYQLYLRGRYLLNKSTQADFQKSVDFFQAAVQKDPNYALAYTGLADAHAQLANFDLVQMNESYPKARQALTRALEIDEKLGEAHASLGFILMNYYWDWTEAEKQLSRAIALDPNYAMAHNWYAQYLVFMNRPDEAFRELRRAQEIDPLSPWINSGFILFLARRYDDAISAASKTLELDPDFSISHMVIGLSYVQKRMFDDAIAELSKAKGNPDSRPLLAYAYALAGQKSEARKIVDELEQLSKSQYVSPFPLAVAYGAMGERDRAFQALDSAYAQRSWAMGMLKVNPACDPLRSDPRFAILLQRVNLGS